MHPKNAWRISWRKQGSVTPFALMNDTEHAVEFFIDKNLSRCKSMGIHPLENTATVFISFKDLDKFLWNLDVDVVKIKLVKVYSFLLHVSSRRSRIEQYMIRSNR
mgnify:CR=1 FL=1